LTKTPSTLKYLYNRPGLNLYPYELATVNNNTLFSQILGFYTNNTPVNLSVD
jgi:hypothetical protein